MPKDMSAARAAKQKQAATEAQSLAAQVRKALATTRDEELKRKLGYVQDQIDSGRRDDVLIGRRRELLREAARHSITAPSAATLTVRI